MKFEKVNGMDLSRFIAAQLLEDSKYYGEKYYEKEDKFTEIIQNCLEKNMILSYQDKFNIYSDMINQHYLEDLNTVLEEKGITVSKDEKEMILEYYKDFLEEHDNFSWHSLVVQAIEKVLY